MKTTKKIQQGVNITTTEDIPPVEAVAKKSMSSVVGITMVQIQREIFFGKGKYQEVGQELL